MYQHQQQRIKSVMTRCTKPAMRALCGHTSLARACAGRGPGWHSCEDQDQRAILRAFNIQVMPS